MKVILNSGFSDYRLKILESVAQIDQKELEFRKKEKRDKSVRILSENYRNFQKIINRVNLKLEVKLKLPEFDIVEFQRTGQLSKELYNLFEYGDSDLMISPLQLMTKIDKL